MSFIKQVFIKLILLTLITFSTNVFADNHDKENKEEALPLNDPFVGDSSFSGGVKVITEGAESLSEQKKLKERKHGFQIYLFVAQYQARVRIFMPT